MRICQRNGPLDTKVSGKGREKGALGIAVEILLQHVEVPTTADYVLKKAAVWGRPHSNRGLTRAAAHGEEHLLIQLCCQDQ